jgi:2,3-bisphosphoglycerate-independent phosphoglycerate mutase
MQTPIAPVVLVILDGWGYRPETEGNAIAIAKPPSLIAFGQLIPAL